MTEAIIGIGPHGEPVTALQAFQQALREVDAEWSRQEDMTPLDRSRLRLAIGPEHDADDYLRGRLANAMAELYLTAKKLPPEIFTMPFEG